VVGSVLVGVFVDDVDVDVDVELDVEMDVNVVEGNNTLHRKTRFLRSLVVVDVGAEVRGSQDVRVNQDNTVVLTGDTPLSSRYWEERFDRSDDNSKGGQTVSEQSEVEESHHSHTRELVDEVDGTVLVPH